MFRLLKLMAFALFGYAVYEFFRGMSDASGGGGGRGFGDSMRNLGRETANSFGQMTGGGGGREEQTLNTDGGSVPHRVGRGVTAGM